MKLSLGRHLLSSFVIFLSVTILMSSILYGTNYAEAKDQCAYSPGLRNHFIKLPDGRCMKVDYYVSVECGREAGLCTPRSPSDLSSPPAPAPTPTPVPIPTSPSSPTQTSDNIWPSILSIIFVLIASYVANKIRKKITRTVRTRKYNSSAQAKQEWERREQERQEREEKPKQESTIDLSKYYRILGLTPGAAKEQIIARFRELTLKYHSDRGGSDDKLKEILEAKEILLNNKKK